MSTVAELGAFTAGFIVGGLAGMVLMGAIVAGICRLNAQLRRDRRNNYRVH